MRKSNTREEDSALNTSRASTASAEATVRTVAMATAVASAVEEATDRTVAATATAGKVAEAILPTVEEATADTKADTATTARSADRASTANAGAMAAAGILTGTADTEKETSEKGLKEADSDQEDRRREGHMEKTVKAGAPTAKTAMKEEGSSEERPMTEEAFLQEDLPEGRVSRERGKAALQQEGTEGLAPLPEGTA